MVQQNRQSLLRHFIAWCLALALLICVSLSVQAAEQMQPSKAVVFLLDASNSMNGNDRAGLAKDSIAQLIYSLPSNYLTGFAAYHNDVVSAVGMQGSDGRESIMQAVDTVTYTGYTNAGAGLAAAMEMLSGAEAEEKTVVILSDGEIVMNSAEATAESSQRFQTAVADAQTQGVKIHVIGLGPEMVDNDSTIFSASSATGGQNYHAPKAADIQDAIDAILENQLGVKKTRAAIIDTDGGMENVPVTIPSANTTKTRILLTSGNPIQNFKAGFTAARGTQYSGARYTLLELEHPASTSVTLQFQGQAGGQVKVDVITEYSVVGQVSVSYTDTEPDDPEAVFYDREAEITISFYDAVDSNRQMLTDPVFHRLSVPVVVNGAEEAGFLEDGMLHLQRSVSETEDVSFQMRFENLDTNLMIEQPLLVSLEAPPALPVPEPPDYRPQMIAGSLCVLALLALIILLAKRRSQKPQKIPKSELETESEDSKFAYSGRLNLYITRTRSGHDFPPLTYNLFRLPNGKQLSLQQVLDSCDVDEPFDGADKILFRPGAGRCLILTNHSDCTLMQNRTILIKGRSYQIDLNSKIDITFEDERSEMAVQYRDVKPSEMRLMAGVR